MSQKVYGGLKSLHKTFRGTAKKNKNKNLELSFTLKQISEMHGREGFCSNVKKS